MMFANKISSSTSCSIWLPETSPPSSSRDLLGHRFQSCNTSIKVHDPQFVPIEFEFDKKARKARVVIPGALETISAPLRLPNTGQEHRVTLQMPEGREYTEMEVAQAMVLEGTAAIKFDHKNTHSSMAEVEHTNAGLKA
jgi:hypothetical protein